MKIVCLALGTVFLILFIVKLFQGKKYQYLVENLDSEKFPIRSLYGVGFSWSQLPVLSLRGKIREKLMGQAKLLYDPKFSEYYASVVWAQFLTAIHFGLTLGFLLAGVTDSLLFLVIGAGIAGFLGFYFINRMNDLLTTRETECTAELPEIVSTMALLINAGMMLRNAWRTVAESKEGTVYELMRDSCVDMDNGMPEVDAIHKFGKLSNSAEIRKFTGALAQSIERGGSELNSFLSRQAIEIWTLKKQLMLQKGEQAASKLLAPTALLFISIIIAVISGAIGMLI